MIIPDAWGSGGYYGGSAKWAQAQ